MSLGDPAIDVPRPAAGIPPADDLLREHGERGSLRRGGEVRIDESGQDRDTARAEPRLPDVADPDPGVGLRIGGKTHAPERHLEETAAGRQRDDRRDLVVPGDLVEEFVDAGDRLVVVGEMRDIPPAGAKHTDPRAPHLRVDGLLDLPAHPIQFGDHRPEGVRVFAIDREAFAAFAQILVVEFGEGIVETTVYPTGEAVERSMPLGRGVAIATETTDDARESRYPVPFGGGYVGDTRPGPDLCPGFGERAGCQELHHRCAGEAALDRIEEQHERPAGVGIEERRAARPERRNIRRFEGVARDGSHVVEFRRPDVYVGEAKRLVLAHPGPYPAGDLLPFADDIRRTHERDSGDIEDVFAVGAEKIRYERTREAAGNRADRRVRRVEKRLQLRHEGCG